MAAPAFLTCFPVYCPHIPAHVSKKRKEDTFPHVAAEKPSNAIMPRRKDMAARHKESPHILTQAVFIRTPTYY